MANFTVTNTNNSGAGSLRQAVIDANKRRGADTITFDQSLSGSTINLTSGRMKIDDDLTIEGLGAENLTIDAGGRSQVFYMIGGPHSGRNTDITLRGLKLTGGFSSGDGGAIVIGHHFYSDLNLTVLDSTLTENKANGNGGAISNISFANSVDIRSSTLSQNSAKESGGAVLAKNLEITGGVVKNNSSIVSGGGLASPGKITVAGTTIENNTTLGYGGGLVGETVIVAGGHIKNNRAGLEGGGIRTEGAALILNSAIVGNEAYENGGGISVGHLHPFLAYGSAKTTLVANSTISGNKAKGNGGGIQVRGQEIQLAPPTGLRGGQASLVATNVTITNNIADSDNNGQGNGGGIYTFPSGVFGTLQTRRYLLRPGNITLQNSILAGNFDTPENKGKGAIAPDISGAARGNANNLLGSTQGLVIDSRVVAAADSLGAGSDIVSASPGLAPLKDNGGQTATHALLPGSPAINGGDNNNVLRETLIDIGGTRNPLVLNFDGNPNTKNALIPHDQRFDKSILRIAEGTVDIGAFEIQNSQVSQDNAVGETLLGTDGKDRLTGTSGDDTLIGKAGRDQLTGGGGRDKFVFQSLNDRFDRINDFEVGADKIVLEDIFQGLSISNYEQALSQGYLGIVSVGKRQKHSRLAIDLDGTEGPGKGKNLVMIAGVTVTELSSAQNFAF